MSDILTDIHKMPPVDTTYVAGRWHRDRVSLDGFKMEARIWAKSLFKPGARDVTKFLVIGRARSGTTLLTRLLNHHSQIRCDTEILSRNVLDPVGLSRRLAQKSDRPVYGYKLLSYQMIQVHRMKDPQRFLRRMEAQGFRFLHLQRDTLSQCLSLTIAQAVNQFHSHKTGKVGLERDVPRDDQGRILLDPQDFVTRIRWAEAMLAYEHAALAGFDRLDLSYETDLATPDQQAQTARRLFDWLGVADEPVQSGMKKMLPSGPRDIVGNWDDLAGALRAADLDHVLKGVA